MNNPFLWAHRGASCCAPENTMAAFAAAFAAGADGLELDVHLSRDGVPVVIHDDTLERTTDGRGRVAQLTCMQLQQLDAGQWFSPDFAGEQLPLLETVLDSYAGVLRLNLEIKEHNAALAVLELLQRYPAADVLVSAFDIRLLARIRALDDRLPLAVLYDTGNWRFALSRASALRACAFHPAAGRISRPLLAACRRAGLAVYVWTVDEAPLARSLVRCGAAGVFTNDPQKLSSPKRQGLRFAAG